MARACQSIRNAPFGKALPGPEPARGFAAPAVAAPMLRWPAGGASFDCRPGKSLRPFARRTDNNTRQKNRPDAAEASLVPLLCRSTKPNGNHFFDRFVKGSPIVWLVFLPIGQKGILQFLFIGGAPVLQNGHAEVGNLLLGSPGGQNRESQQADQRAGSGERAFPGGF